MNHSNDANTEIETLMEKLAIKDGLIREKARKSLVEIGEPAIPSLIKALDHSQDEQVRWEAAKALGAIGDRRSIPVLVKALEDISSDVAWLAAEALVPFGQAAWMPIFDVLMKPDTVSNALRQGAHHVLWKQKSDEFDDLLQIVIQALDSSMDSASLQQDIHHLMTKLKAKA